MNRKLLRDLNSVRDSKFISLKLESTISYIRKQPGKRPIDNNGSMLTMLLDTYYRRKQSQEEKQACSEEDRGTALRYFLKKFGLSKHYQPLASEGYDRDVSGLFLIRKECFEGLLNKIKADQKDSQKLKQIRQLLLELRMEGESDSKNREEKYYAVCRCCDRDKQHDKYDPQFKDLIFNSSGISEAESELLKELNEEGFENKGVESSKASDLRHKKLRLRSGVGSSVLKILAPSDRFLTDIQNRQNLPITRPSTSMCSKDRDSSFLDKKALRTGTSCRSRYFPLWPEHDKRSKQSTATEVTKGKEYLRRLVKDGDRIGGVRKKGSVPIQDRRLNFHTMGNKSYQMNGRMSPPSAQIHPTQRKRSAKKRKAKTDNENKLNEFIENMLTERLQKNNSKNTTEQEFEEAKEWAGKRPNSRRSGDKQRVKNRLHEKDQNDSMSRQEENLEGQILRDNRTEKKGTDEQRRTNTKEEPNGCKVEDIRFGIVINPHSPGSTPQQHQSGFPKARQLGPGRILGRYFQGFSEGYRSMDRMKIRSTFMFIDQQEMLNCLVHAICSMLGQSGGCFSMQQLVSRTNLNMKKREIPRLQIGKSKTRDQSPYCRDLMEIDKRGLKKKVFNNSLRKVVSNASKQVEAKGYTKPASKPVDSPVVYRL